MIIENGSFDVSTGIGNILPTRFVITFCIMSWLKIRMLEHVAVDLGYTQGETE
jgi:hypothetical protein